MCLLEEDNSSFLTGCWNGKENPIINIATLSVGAQRKGSTENALALLHVGLSRIEDVNTAKILPHILELAIPETPIASLTDPTCKEF